jgi:hypothetical protein
VNPELTTPTPQAWRLTLPSSGLANIQLVLTVKTLSHVSGSRPPSEKKGYILKLHSIPELLRVM